MKFRKFFSFLLLAVLLASPLALAGKISEDGVGEGQFHDINLSTGLNATEAGGEVTIATELYNDGRNGTAALTLASSSTVITDSSLPYSVILKSVGGGGGLDSTGIGTTLGNASVDGTTISIIIVGLQSGGSWIVTPTTASGFTKITFDTKGDTATLQYVNSTIGWIVKSNGGAVLTQS